jgi:hypothetical protein
LDYLVAVFIGVFCAAVSFWFFALLGMDFRLHKSDRVNWRDILHAGGGASVLNSMGTKIFFDNDLPQRQRAPMTTLECDWSTRGAVSSTLACSSTASTS